ncbi:hypothetical protein Tco_1266754 [Tanacetum coccineum]
MPFHIDEGVFCYTKMPLGLKNVGVTYQRLVDTIFEGQIGRNLEAYVDDMVIKNKTEQDLIKDIKETLLTLKKKDFRWMEVVKEAFHAMKRLIVELPTLIATIKDEELMVYLSVANEALSAVLLVERNGGRCDSLRKVLADFLVDTMTGDDATSERTPSLKAILDSKEVPESSKSKENKQTQTLWSRQTHESYTLMEHPMIMDPKKASS